MSSKKYELSGIGAPLLDIHCKVTEDQLTTLGYEKGTMRFVDIAGQMDLLGFLDRFDLTRRSGGSLANSIILFSQLGGKASFQGIVGDDENGRFFRDEFIKLGIGFPVTPKKSLATGTCISLVTPDSERTMRTSLGSAGSFDIKDLSLETISDSDWFFIEGYSYANFQKPNDIIRKIIDVSKNSQTKVALTVSEPWVVEQFKDQLMEVLPGCSLVFTNEHEAQALSGEKDVEAAISKLKGILSDFVVTLGSKGAFAYINGTEYRGKGFSVETVDVTGAGDAFAGAFLYGLINNMPIESTIKSACYLASKVVSQVGARLSGDVKNLFFTAT